jgi:SAM-dependent methyltransferase
MKAGAQPMHENLREFTNPARYDAENRWGADDDFYLALARRAGGPVLDVACGTGRLTRAIAAAGLPTTGMDIMQPMLDHAAALDVHGAVAWVQGDCHTFALAGRFRLALMTSHAFQFLPTAADQIATLECIHAHLAPNGLFAFETRNPPADGDRAAAPTPQTHTVQDAHGRWLDVQITSRYDPESQIERFEKVYTVRETGKRRSYAFSLRYTRLEQLNILLHAHGFVVSSQYGDWDASPVTPISPEIITICRRA